MSEHGLEFRHATEADLEAEYEVFVAAQGELMHRHGLRWSAAPFEAWSAPHRHLLTADGERSFVALDGERLAGFSAALARGDTWFLAALFVSPDDQGRRVGRELLDRSWAGDWQRRMTITESIQPVSTGMYARRGLIPTTPILTLSGTPRCELPDGLQAVPPEPDVLATLDRGAYGFDRGTDHRFWGERAAQANLWLLDGEPIAYAYVDRQGLIGPLAGRDGAAAALALRAELARRASQPTEMLLPGTTPGLVEAALASGLRLTRPPGLLLLSQGTDPPKALAISGYWLL
jgi:GNAT superfamily N-acetyltransferase